MLGSLSRSLLLTATLGLLGACDLIEEPKEEAPTVEAVPARKPVAAPAPAPVKKKTPVIKFDDGGSGGGGWG